MKRIIGLILLGAQSLSVLAQRFNTEKLDRFIEALSSRGLVNGSIAISQNGIVKYQRGIGYATMENDKKTATTKKTKYRIGSATKMFTAVMIFQLMEEGKIKPVDRLSSFYPGLPNADKITIQDMLYHRSGLHDYTRDTDFISWMDKPKSHEEMLNIIKEKGGDFEPGAKADYCNSNYLLLGYIIEKLDKTNYADAVKKRITSKLKLSDTYYGNPISLSNNESVSYKYGNGNWIKEKETDLTIHGGAGSLVSTPADLVQFINGLFAYKLVSKRSVAKMKTLVDEYGMGLFANKYGNEQSFGHNGRIEEFYSATWYFPNQNLAIAYCSNGILYPRQDLIEGVLKVCFNEPFVIPFTKANAIQSGDLDKYIGKYSAGPLVVNCTKDGARLLLETQGKVFDVEKVSDNYFMNMQSGYFFEFFPDRGELRIKETDNVYVLKR